MRQGQSDLRAQKCCKAAQPSHPMSEASGESLSCSTDVFLAQVGVGILNYLFRSMPRIVVVRLLSSLLLTPEASSKNSFPSIERCLPQRG